MDTKVKQFLHETFSELETKYGYTVAEEYDNNSTYFIDYQSCMLTLELTAYHHEFSATLLKKDIEQGVALFNLLDYLGCDISWRGISHFPKEGTDLNERYKAQLIYLADIIHKNIDLINEFFSRTDIKEQFSEMTRFVVKKYPNLFKT